MEAEHDAERPVERHGTGEQLETGSADRLDARVHEYWSWIAVVLFLLVTPLFDRVVGLLRRTSDPFDRYLAAGIEAWLGGLLAAGLLVFANNLAVIFFGRSRL